MRVAALASAALLAGCASFAERESGAPYTPDRRDYAAFRAAYADVLEPNYLPFMVHRAPQSGGRDDLMIFCRWSDEEMPLPVYI